MKKQYMKPEMAEVIISTMSVLAASDPDEKGISTSSEAITDGYADSREYDDFDD